MQLENVGGALAILFGVGHFVGDWVLQTHQMAMRKVGEPRVRAVHCAIYTAVVAVIALIWRGDPSAWEGRWTTFAAVVAWLFASHFVIDSYKPLFRFRQVMRDPFAKDLETFKERFQTPAGFVVYVTLDQVFHLLCMVPVALAVCALPV